MSTNNVVNLLEIQPYYKWDIFQKDIHKLKNTVPFLLLKYAKKINNNMCSYAQLPYARLEVLL